MQVAHDIFVRPGELQHTTWEEGYFDQAFWTISASKTKMRKDCLILLSRQVLSRLKQFLDLIGPEGISSPAYAPAPDP